MPVPDPIGYRRFEDRDRRSDGVDMLLECSSGWWPLGEELGQFCAAGNGAGKAPSWPTFSSRRLAIVDAPGHRRRISPPVGRLEQLDRFERAPDVPGAVVDVT